MTSRRSSPSSQPEHDFEYLRDELTTPMRDGTKLKADLYLPKGPGPWPVLIERTPYNKESSSEVKAAESPPYYSARGYAVVIQDVRGRHKSEGDFYAYHNDGWGANRDGYDTIQWLAEQSWCNGKIGMIGGSYSGLTQYAAAATRPPHLTALFPRQAAADAFNGLMFKGGAFDLGLRLNWALTQTRHDLDRLASGTERDRLDRMLGIAAKEMESWYEYLPLSGMPLLKGIADWYYDWLAHPVDGPFWWQISPNKQYAQIDVPVCHFGGWFDIYQQSIVDNFVGMAHGARTQHARKSQKMIMGPWQHGPTSVDRTNVGEFDFGPGAARDFNDLRLPWYDHWVKGIENGIMDEPPVSYLTMGVNEWRTSVTWPPAGFTDTPFYFNTGPSGSAESLNDGRLLTDLPHGVEGADSYLYDPADPVRTHGGALAYPADPPAGAYDQRPVEKRCLTYTSDPLERSLDATGRIRAVLFALSSAPDTDWVVRVCDVYPDGRSRPVAEGVLRARYRDSMIDPQVMEPGKIYQFGVDLGSTSNVFLAGHRIRVTVTSSCFPRWDRNLNTGGPFGMEAEGMPAVNSIFRDRFRPSHVSLPVRAQ